MSYRCSKMCCRSSSETEKAKVYRCVKRVWLKIGQLSCVEPKALCFAFDAVMKDALADRAVAQAAACRLSARTGVYTSLLRCNTEQWYRVSSRLR
jgi:Zn finger protein HypA/HybF involved in hydrogenase expression